jgi:hypothetical protein
MAKGKNAKEAEKAGRLLVETVAEDIFGLALEVHGNLVEATPVDTGHARINWTPTLVAPSRVEIPGADPGAAVDPVAALGPASPGDAMVIANNVPYIRRLNEGSSPQAPAGFVEKAVEAAVKRRKDRRLK